MSLFIPFPRGVQVSRNWAEGRPASNDGTTVTAAGSSHSLGDFATLFTSTAHDAYWVRIAIGGTAANATQTDALVNIYIGADGAEQLLIPNLLAGAAALMVTNSNAQERMFEFPLFIPQGSQLKAKAQALIASETVLVRMELYGGGEPMGWTGRGVECIGASAAASQGVSVTPGTASEGSFTNIGTTAREWKYILPMVQGTLTDTNSSTNIIAVDVGVGDATFAGLESFWFFVGTIENTYPAFGGRGRHCIIPAGTTLQLRGQVSGATAEAFDAVIYGVY